MHLRILICILLVPLAASTRRSSRPCNPSCLKLSDLEVWRREQGWWVGNYTLYGPEGDPFVSSDWPYNYAQYRGFIHIELKGPCLQQRNVFLYPPLPKTDCTGPDNVRGEGKCGINGNERVFEAEQNAVDCDGNLAGPFGTPPNAFDTETIVTIGNDDTVLYQVRLPKAAGGALFQNQLTTLSPDGTRLRTAQGLVPGTATARSLSFFRERRVSKKEWMKQLAETRAKFNILESDYCGWDIAAMRTTKTCEEHFTTPKCAVKPRNRRKCLRKLRRYRRSCKPGFMEECRCLKH